MNNEVSELITILKNSREGERFEAVKKLVQIGEPSVEALIEALGTEETEEIEYLACTALIKIGIPSIKPILEVFKTDPYQSKFKRIFFGVGAPAVTVLIKETQATQNTNIYHLACSVISLMGEEAIGPLVDAMKTGSNKEAEFSTKRLKYLASKPRERVLIVKHLKAILEDRKLSKNVKSLAWEVLIEIIEYIAEPES